MIAQVRLSLTYPSFREWLEAVVRLRLGRTNAGRAMQQEEVNTHGDYVKKAMGNVRVNLQVRPPRLCLSPAHPPPPPTRAPTQPSARRPTFIKSVQIPSNPQPPRSHHSILHSNYTPHSSSLFDSRRRPSLSATRTPYPPHDRLPTRILSPHPRNRPRNRPRTHTPLPLSRWGLRR